MGVGKIRGTWTLAEAAKILRDVRPEEGLNSPDPGIDDVLVALRHLIDEKEKGLLQTITPIQPISNERLWDLDYYLDGLNLSQDDRAIASLDVGEAIITSTFSKFAIPVKIPLFKNLAKQTGNSYKTEYVGLH